MVNKVLYAYEDKLKGFSNSNKKENRILLIMDLLYFIMNMFIVMCVFFSVFKNKYKCSLYLIIGYIIFIIIWIFLFRKINEKRWHDNLLIYDEELDLLKSLLKDDFNMVNKNEIKQLIHKYKYEIEEYNSNNFVLKEKYNKFFGIYIIPVIAFCAGKIFNGFNDDTVIVICFLAICTVFIFAFLCYAVNTIKTEIIDGNIIERKRDISNRLQDLLDRDFEITEEDLL